MNATTSTDILELLRPLPLFQDVSPTDLERLASRVSERPLAAGEVLFLQNDDAHESFLILSGELEVITYLNGVELRLEVRQAGELIGEMALIDNSPRSATVRAVSESRVAVLDEDAFYTLLLSHSALAVEMLRRGTSSLRNTSQRMISNLEAKNTELLKAYDDLKAAQDELIFLNRIQEEMTVARRIQRQFLPGTLPQIDGWQLAALNRGAQAVGGDFFDCVELPDNRLGLVVADVCGKGVPAALFVALTRSLLRAASQTPWEFKERPTAQHRDVLTRALWFTNDYIAREHGESNMFITVFYAVLEPETGRISYVNAGHNPPLMISGDGKHIRELESYNLPVGIIETESYSAAEFVMEAGEMLVAFSDGITEAMNPAGEPYGDERFIDELRANCSLSAQELTTTIEQRVDEYAAGAPQADDMTLLILRRAP
jgi:serine phosphatase RsbU (regulator of sigma subunit)